MKAKERYIYEEKLQKFCLWRIHPGENDEEGLRKRLFAAVHKDQVETQNRPNSFVVKQQDKYGVKYVCKVDQKNSDEVVNGASSNGKRLCSFVFRAQKIEEGAVVKEYVSVHSCDGHLRRERNISLRFVTANEDSVMLKFSLDGRISSRKVSLLCRYLLFLTPSCYIV